MLKILFKKEMVVTGNRKNFANKSANFIKQFYKIYLNFTGVAFVLILFINKSQFIKAISQI